MDTLHDSIRFDKEETLSKISLIIEIGDNLFVQVIEIYLMRYYILLKDKISDSATDPYYDVLRSSDGDCQVDYIPVLQLSGVNPDPDIIQSISQYEAVIMTSANTIRYLPDTIHLSSHTRCYSVGPATTRQIQGQYPLVQVRTAPVPESAAALADFIVEDLGPPGPVLFLCGDPHRPELTQRLTKGGIQVQELVVYKSRPRSDIAERIRSLNIDLCHDTEIYIIIFSGEGGRALIQQYPDLHLTLYHLVAIGRTTASVLGRYYSGPILIASSPSPSGLIFKEGDAVVADHDRDLSRSTAIRRPGLLRYLPGPARPARLLFRM